MDKATALKANQMVFKRCVHQGYEQDGMDASNGMHILPQFHVSRPAFG
jgi:hypothetical protein